MKQLNKIHSKLIESFSSNSLYERAGVRIGTHEFLISRPSRNEICRIIHCCNRTFISIDEEHTEIVYNYLNTNNILEKLCSPLFYREILGLLELDHNQFSLEPSEEFLQKKKYNCVHTLDYVCDKDNYISQNTEQVEKISSGDKRFILDDNFDSTMYCITENNRIISCSYYKPNNGVFESTCSMQVYSHPEHRKKGYGKMTAAVATQAVVEKNKLALWVCQVENIPSRKIAESLGYILLGGELRIVK